MKRNAVVMFAALAAILTLALTVGTAAGPPAVIITWAGTPQSTAVNSNFQVTMVAVVRDTATNGVQGASVTFTAPSSGPSGTFNGALTATVSTDGSGIARAPMFRANGIGGSFVVTATTAGVSGGAQFALTNTGSGGGGGGGGVPAAPVNVHIVPTSAGPASNVSSVGGSGQSTTVNMGFAASLQARVTDASGNPVSGITVTFTLPANGASARFSGSAVATATTDAGGVATAPALTANGTTGTYTASATAAGVAASATFTLTNAPPGTAPPPDAGSWTNVTPPGFSTSPNLRGANDNYGFQQVLVDPVRPSDLYVFTNYQGVWKSTNYGVTWTRISTGSNSEAINSGRNWAAVIDPNKSRNPATPPTLYTQAGYSTIGQMGIWKSTDGGVNWTYAWNTVFAADGSTNVTSQVGTDMQGLSIDPNNSQHLLAVNHGNTSGGSYNHHIFESQNGGATWVSRGNPAGGTHCAVSFITSTTWIATAEGWGGNAPGSFVTTNSGASWTRIGQFGKAHGNVQLTYLTPSGTLYLAAMEGIYRAEAPYLSWSQVAAGSSQSIIGTPNFLYASFGWASLGNLDPALKRASAASGQPWANTPTPPGMTNGAMGAAVTFDPTVGKHVVITGNWLGGLWRYVE